MAMGITESWTMAIDSYLNSLRAGGAPSTTLATRRQHLTNLARAVGPDPWSVTADELVEWFGSRDWKTETRRGRRSSFLSFWKWAVASGRTEANPAALLPVVKAGEARPRPAPDRVYNVARMAAGPRERLILRFAAEMGLRRAEVAQIHSDDVIEDLIGFTLVVHGKGAKTRLVPLPPGIVSELRMLPAGYVFPGQDHGHLSARWVGKLVTMLMPEGWTMHTLRHRFATMAYGVDRDVFAVQELLGHASPARTRRYVQIPNDALRRTVMAVAS